MPVLNQPSHRASPRACACPSPLLLVLAAALAAACGDESPAPGLLLFDRDAYDFGQLHVGETSDEHVFTVRNAGPERLDGLRVRLEPGDAFELVGTTCAGWLEASETCTITIAFAPALAGAALADVVVEADRADASAALTGVGAVTVRVVNHVADSALVESTPAGIRCGSMCEATFTVPEIVLSVRDGGVATWSGPCETAGGGACRLRLQGDASVELLVFTSALQWVFRGSGLVNELAIDAENNVIATGGGTPHLLALSPAGELLWQTDDFGPRLTAAVDASGNIGLGGYEEVRKLDGAGNPQWDAWLAPMTITGVAFDPAGNLYATGTARTEEDAIVHLVKFDGNGDTLWYRLYSPAALSEVQALAVDGDGNVIVAGYANPAPEEGGVTIGFLRKYDGDGNVLVTNEDTGMLGFELAVDAAGNIFLADRIGGGAPGSYTLKKYAPNGTLLWESQGDDIGGLVSGLAVTPAGDVIAVGTRYDEEDRAVGVWAAKFEGEDGTRRRPIEIRLQGDQQFGRDVAVDGNGDVLIAGGEEEPWIRKYDGAAFDQPAD